MSASVIEHIEQTCGKLGEVQIGGFKLESAAAGLLDVLQFGLDEHVSRQPAAIAYYGALKKQAARRLAALERVYERWQKKKYAESKVSVESGVTNKGSIKVEDIKSRFIVDNEVEIEKREAEIARAQLEYDTLDVWYEAWKQKSFSMREMVAIEDDEKYTSGSIMKTDGEKKSSPTELKMDKMREIFRRRRMGAQQ